MRKLFFTLLCIPFFSGAQSISRSILSSAGTISSNTDLTLEWTLGEMAIQKVSNDRITFTQGFHQTMRNSSTGMNPIADQLSMSLWPNPANSFLTVALPAAEYGSVLTLTDMNGRKLGIRTVQESETSFTLDVSNLEPGLYFLSVFNTQGLLLHTAKICTLK